MSSYNLIAGSRGSKLALIQTQIVVDLLKAQNPSLSIQIQVIRTSGDNGNLQKLGAFISEIESALLTKKIDFAIHSLKDLPAVSTQGLKLSAILPREDASEAIVLKKDEPFDPTKNYTIGSSSPRRRLLLKYYFPNFKVVPINGNVDTRISKVDSGELDGVMLATAGLKRIGLKERISEKLPLIKFLPAPGQGALAVQTRVKDQETENLILPLNNKCNALETHLERIMLEEINSGCSVPLGAYALLKSDDMVEISAFYGLNNQGNLNIQSLLLNTESAELQCRELAARLKEKYAG